MTTNNESNSYHVNGFGIAGFLLSLVSIFVMWMPLVKWLILLPALLFCFIGLFIRHRFFAFLGFLICIAIIAISVFGIGGVLSFVLQIMDSLGIKF